MHILNIRWKNKMAYLSKPFNQLNPHHHVLKPHFHWKMFEISFIKSVHQIHRIHKVIHIIHYTIDECHLLTSSSRLTLH